MAGACQSAEIWALTTYLVGREKSFKVKMVKATHPTHFFLSNYNSKEFVFFWSRIDVTLTSIAIFKKCQKN